MLSIFISSKTDIVVLSIGNVLATASQLVLLVPFIYKKGCKYKFVFDIKDKHIKAMALIALSVIIGTSVNQINTLVNRTLASQLAVGGISALNYANKIPILIQDIFVMSIATVIYPAISKMALINNMRGLKKSISKAINSINLLVVPSTVGVIIFANPIINLLYGRGAFDILAINMTSKALVFYSLGMIGIGLREILSRTFYSLQDTKTPMINAAISMVINIALNIILSKYMGVGGLALANSISAVFCTGLLFISLRKKIDAFSMKQVSISFFKIIFASLVMAMIAKLSFEYLTYALSQHKALIISIVVGVMSYFTIIIYFMKIDEVDIMVNAIKNKFKR